MSYDNELYQQVILDHNRKPRNFREIIDATHSCHGVNPLCGDEMLISLKVSNNKILIININLETSVGTLGPTPTA